MGKKSEYTFAKLSGAENYKEWAREMISALKGSGLWGYVDDIIIRPAPLETKEKGETVYELHHLDTLTLSQISYIRWLSYHDTTLPRTTNQNQKPWRKTIDQRQDAFVYHLLSSSSTPVALHQARILEDGTLYCFKAGFKVVGKDGDNR